MKSILSILFGSGSAVIVREIAKIIIETKTKKDLKRLEDSNRKYVDGIAEHILSRVYKDIKNITIVLRLVLIGFFLTAAMLAVLIVLFIFNVKF